MRRLAKQFELGGQRRDTHIRLGAREVRLKCLSLISSFRQSLKRFSLLGSHWRDRVQFFNLHGGARRRGEGMFSHLSQPSTILTASMTVVSRWPWQYWLTFSSFFLIASGSMIVLLRLPL